MARTQELIGSLTRLGVLAAVLSVAGCPKPNADEKALSGGLPAKVVSRMKDAVVLIEVKLTTVAGEQQGSGSGFLVSEEGYIITNAHVVSLVTETPDGEPLVASARDVKVVLHPSTPEEKTVPATVVREHPVKDLALLQIKETPPAILELANSDKATETTRIWACGHPLGLREISFRQGTVTARRTWDDRPFIEHDAMAEGGNSGGPIINGAGKVVGVHVQSMGASGDMLTKLAIPSNVVTEWLASDPKDDPEPVMPGDPNDPLRVLLTSAKLHFEEPTPGLYSLDYDNGVTMLSHAIDEFYRVMCPLEALAGDSVEEQTEWALQALRFNYADPVGHLSLGGEEGQTLYWEALVPSSVVTAAHLKELSDVGASQVERWRQVVAGGELEDAEYLFPGGDKAAQLTQLQEIIDQTGYTYEQKHENTFSFETKQGRQMHATIYRGLAYTYMHVGGMPGLVQGGEDLHQAALDLLRRNDKDAFGRLALDKDDDVIWECQIPVDFLTPDYFDLLANNGVGVVSEYIEAYGEVPFKGGQD
jgi:S1-C subfamily serine protease